MTEIGWEAGMLTVWLGMLLVVGGVLYMAGQAIWRGRLSGQGRSRAASPMATLEPSARGGDGVFGLARNWPGFALMALGAILLLVGVAL